MLFNAFILFLILIGSITTCKGQQLLFYKNQHKSVMYKEGDVISFSTKDDQSKMTSRILGFEGDTLIVFQNYKINPNDIIHVYVDDKTRGWYPLRYRIDKLLLIAGVGYTLLDLVNETIINGSPVDENVLVVGGTLVGAGLLTRWLISDKIKIKGRRKLLIIDQMRGS